MNRRIVIITIFLVALVMGAGFLLLSKPVFTDIIDGYKRSSPNPQTMTDQEIRVKFNCERNTLEHLATDIYCSQPELFRQHAKQGKVIPTP